MLDIKFLTLLLIALPILSSIIAGFSPIFKLKRSYVHIISILLMLFCFFVATDLMFIATNINTKNNIFLFNWMTSGSFSFDIGFLIDRLSVSMLLVVSFISLMVHIYSVAYMKSDSKDYRFFAYISGFTAAMILLILANNFLLLFFAWEFVGLFSYLLIGYWFSKEYAVYASLKAFIVNRIADTFFIIAIAFILYYFHSLQYDIVFNKVFSVSHQNVNLFDHSFSVVSVICLLLFIGAMGKSAQMPFHIWLPDSMAGPTPISALIHAATMVTAGVYLLARCSYLFEYSDSILNFILIIGATTALFCGLLAIVTDDIKKVIAYSTLSQLGYMVAASGVSAYNIAIFHLFTHACFKALLFLAAGAIIVAQNGEKNINKMSSSLYKKMPITYICFVIGLLALIAIPPFSGFYSKDSILLAIRESRLHAAFYADICLFLGVAVTACYSIRLLLKVFHNNIKTDYQIQGDIKLMLLPLILLALAAIFSGILLVKPLVYAKSNFFAKSILILSSYHNSLISMRHNFNSILYMSLEYFTSYTVIFTIIGIVVAYILVYKKYNYCTNSFLVKTLYKQYGFDYLTKNISKNILKLSNFLFRSIDIKILDKFMIDGGANIITKFSKIISRIHSGFLDRYILFIVLGVIMLAIILYIK